MSLMKKIILCLLLVAQCEASFFNNENNLTDLKVNDADKSLFIEIFNERDLKEEFLNLIKASYPNLKIIVIPMRRVDENEVILWRDATLSDEHYDWFLSLSNIALAHGAFAEYVAPDSVTEYSWSIQRPLMEYGQMLVRNDTVKITFAHELIHHIVTGTGRYDFNCAPFPDLIRDTKVSKSNLLINSSWGFLFKGETYYKMDNDTDAEMMLDHLEKAFEEIRCIHGNELDTSITLLKAGDEFVGLFKNSELEFEREIFYGRMQRKFIKKVNSLGFKIEYLIEYLNQNPQSNIKENFSSFLETYKSFVSVANSYMEYTGQSFSKIKEVEGL